MRSIHAGLALVMAALLLPAVAAEAGIQSNTIGATAALIGQGHVAIGTVLLECTAGQQIQFTLTLTQAGASGTGRGAGVCTGALTSYEVTVPARGDRFTEGAATACATAANQDQGVLADSRQWCRAGSVALSTT